MLTPFYPPRGHCKERVGLFKCLTSEEIVWSTCSPVEVPGNIEKAVFSTVVVQ